MTPHYSIPAFPVMDMGTNGAYGMTLRDYLAARAPRRSMVDRKDMSRFLGVPAPAWDSDYKEQLIFWNKFDAKARYMWADAMIEARGA